MIRNVWKCGHVGQKSSRGSQEKSSENQQWKLRDLEKNHTLHSGGAAPEALAESPSVRTRSAW